MPNVMRHPWLGSVGSMMAVGVTAVAGSLSAESARRGHTARPPGTAAIDRAVFDSSLELFHDEGLVRAHTRLYLAHDKGLRTHSLSRADKDEVSSVAWRLPPGVIAVLYEHSGGRGRQVHLWGEGLCSTLEPLKMNDATSGWMWAFLGGVTPPPPMLAEARSARPPGSRPTSALLSTGAIHLFQFHEFEGQRAVVDDLTSAQPREFHPLPAVLDGTAKSLRWDLPDAVIVVLAEGPQGQGSRYALWGRGEMRTTRRWGSKGGVTSWAWFYIGAPPADDIAEN